MKPLVDKKYLLEKYPGKGGWTYARIPEVLKEAGTPFGWVRVMGMIDDVEIFSYHLMPMGDGTLILPVNAYIRKRIKKEAGDTIHVVLYRDDTPLEIPGEFELCLADEPEAKRFFYQLSEGEKKYYVEWIFSAKKEETRAVRMATAINRLANGLKRYDRG